MKNKMNGVCALINLVLVCLILPPSIKTGDIFGIVLITLNAALFGLNLTVFILRNSE